MQLYGVDFINSSKTYLLDDCYVPGIVLIKLRDT